MEGVFMALRHFAPPLLAALCFTILAPQAASAAEAGACRSTADSCLTERHLTFRKYEGDTEMICTSQKKLPQCAPECRPTGYEAMKVLFDCVAASRSAQRPGQHEEEYHFVEVPTKCVPL